MEKNKNNQKKMTIFDRMIIAFSSGLTAFVTIVIYYLVVSVAILREGEFDAIPMIYSFIKKFGIYPIGLASCVGFFAGPEKMADIFSYFWGTHPAMKKELQLSKTAEWIIALSILAGAVYIISMICRLNADAGRFL